ncbi:MAG: HIG1 domain-containing protein [Alphaproteobacteria bacterium]
MVFFLNTLIVICLITTFGVLLAGLFYTARSGDDKNNKINLFMRYRVLIQFISLIVLTIALFVKS